MWKCLILCLLVCLPFLVEELDGANGGGGGAQSFITAVIAGNGLTGGGDRGVVTVGIQIPLNLNGSEADPTIKGINTANGNGLYGSSSGAAGVVGASADNTGVQGSSVNGVGVSGNNSSGGTFGYIGGGAVGVHGKNTRSGNWGNLGDDEYGVYGHSESNVAVYGKNSASMNVGYLASGDYGVYGQSADGYAVYGRNTASDNIGMLGGGDCGVSGRSAGIGVRGFNSGSSTTGELGAGNCGVYGYGGADFDGVHGVSIGGGTGLYGSSISGTGVHGMSESGFAGRFDGDVKVVGKGIVNVLEIIGGSDLSEQFEIRGGRGDLSPIPGMVVSIDPEHPGDLSISETSYDRRVAGVMSGAGDVRPGMIMGQRNSAADGSNPVALSGRVYVWADASKGPIAPGDLLTTSEIPGHAMKVTDHTKAQGAILGKAMSRLESGRGLVLALVTLQ